MWKNFKEMPFLLKLLTIATISPFPAFLGSIIPHNSFYINGELTTYSEWWFSGAGVQISLLSVLLPLSGYLILKKYIRARGVFIFIMFVLLNLFEFIIPLLNLDEFAFSMPSSFNRIEAHVIEPVPRELGFALFELIPLNASLGVIYLYLSLRRPVVEYFSSNQ